MTVPITSPITPIKPWEANIPIATTAPALPPRPTFNSNSFFPNPNTGGMMPYYSNNPYYDSGYRGYGGYGSGYRPNYYSSGSPSSPIPFIDQLVQAFSSISYMIDATVHGTTSSFMAVMQVLDQFNMLKSQFGQAMSIVGLVQSLRSLLKKPKRSFWIWLVIVGSICLYILKRNRVASIDPSQCTFAKALYSFQAQSASDLTLNVGEIVAITERDVSGWCKGRTRDGRIGWFPENYVMALEKNEKE